MSDDDLVQQAKVFAPAPQVSEEGRIHLETTLADVAHIPPSGLTDADVRRLEHPEEFPPRVRVLPSAEAKPVGRHVGVVDEYGTVWAGEPGASKIVGDLLQRDDEETSDLYLRRKWWQR